MDTLTDLLGRLTALIDSLTQLVTDSPITYLVVFAFAAVDVLFPILPSETVITTAAVLAGQGTLNIVWIMVAAGLGAFVGDNVAYWVGRVAGRPLVERVLRGNMDMLVRVQGQFRTRGGILIVIGRFIPGGRTAVSVGAGVLHFSWPRFLLYDGIAAVIWPIPAALPGYIIGVVVQDTPWLALLLGIGLSAIVASAMALIERWWVRRHPLPPAAADSLEGDPDGPAAKVEAGASGTDDEEAHTLEARGRSSAEADRTPSDVGTPSGDEGATPSV